MMPASRRRLAYALAFTGSCMGAAILVLGLLFGLGLAKPAEASTDGSTTAARGLLASVSCPANAMQGYELTSFILGDWGMNGRHQRAVSEMMGRLGACYKPSFVISTGDNFYPSGLKGLNDPYFKTAFSDMYSAPSLKVPWYAVLGNHDWGDSLDAGKLAGCSAPTLSACPKDCCYSPVWETMMNQQDSRWNAYQGVWKKSFLNGKLDIIFIDTTPLIPGYHAAIWAHNPGGIASRSPPKDLAAIQFLLSRSTAQWKLVVGHHPVRSFGEHCKNNPDCPNMQFLRPWLRKYKVAAYISGHDHDLQLIKTDGNGPAVDLVYYVVSGAGGNTRAGEFDGHPASVLKDARFLSDVTGFVAAGIKGNTLTLHYWTVNSVNAPAYAIDIPRPSW